jgi:hypothetical protein
MECILEKLTICNLFNDITQPNVVYRLHVTSEKTKEPSKEPRTKKKKTSERRNQPFRSQQRLTFKSTIQSNHNVF